MVLKKDEGHDSFLHKARRGCRISYSLLRILLIAIILLWLLPLLFGLLGFAFPYIFRWVDGLELSIPFDSLIFGLLPAAFIGIAALILRDISKGETPFSRKQSKRIRLIAYLMFAQIVFKLLFSTAITGLYPDGLVFLGFYHIPSSSAPTVYLDFMELIFAIICYCISLVFEYGVLLQSNSDNIL